MARVQMVLLDFKKQKAKRLINGRVQEIADMHAINGSPESVKQIEDFRLGLLYLVPQPPEAA